jgi:hypothetical protein
VSASRHSHCNFCGTKLDLGREFVYQVESLQFEENEFVLETIRRLPYYCGEPLRFCKACHASFTANQREIADEQKTAEVMGRAAWKFVRVGLWVPLGLAAAFGITAIVRAFLQ